MPDGVVPLTRQVLSAKRCWATTLDGSPCQDERLPTCLPYCARHLEVGDEAFRKVQHTDPRLGNILVARFPLPARYYAAFWGRCVPSAKASGGQRPVGSQDYVMEFDDDRNIDPTDYPGSVLQYAACPGPDELDNIVYADESAMADLGCDSDFTDGSLAGIVMVTRREVCLDEQVLMAYEADEAKTARWFMQAHCEWTNVGCEEFPARRHHLVATVTDELFEERRWSDYQEGRTMGSADTPKLQGTRNTASFDAAVSLGPNCLAAYRIAKANFKRRSFPFDIMMSGSDGWPAYEEACWQAPVGLSVVVECLSRFPAFRHYVSQMVLLPHIKAVGNRGFAAPDGRPIPSAHIHDDPRDPAVAKKYGRRAQRFMQLLSSDYRVLFFYTLRLRDFRDEIHVSTVCAGLVSEARLLCKLFHEEWPGLDYCLLVPVLGDLHESFGDSARASVEQALHDLSAECGGQVAVERLRDAAAGPDPMDGFWGDDASWTELFARYRVQPRDFSDECFAASTKSGAPKGASEDSARPAKFERFLSALGEVAPD